MRDLATDPPFTLNICWEQGVIYPSSGVVLKHSTKLTQKQKEDILTLRITRII